MLLENVILICVVLCAGVIILFQQRKYDKLQKKYMDAEGQRRELIIILEKERSFFEEKIAFLENAHQKFSDQFKAVSADALKMNNQSF